MSIPNMIRESGLEEYMLSGHPACTGCGAALSLRLVLKAAGKNTILVIPAGCSSIIAGIGRKASINVPVLHIAFAAAPPSASGISRALSVLGKKDTNVLIWAGDGATFDIGFGSMSGAAERMENILYICNDNEAYMNTGIQKSGATPTGAWTTTTVRGREGRKKDLFSIMLDHRIPYIATASPAYPLDLMNKVRKALKFKGFKLIHILNPCPPGWRYDHNLTIEVARKAVLSGAWILMEAEYGKIKLNPPSSEMIESRPIKVAEYLLMQGRFKHLTKERIDEIQRMIDEDWNKLKIIIELQK